VHRRHGRVQRHPQLLGTALTGAAAAGGIALINSIGNLGGFSAPYATGALNQFTGSDKAGMWAVGVFMVISAVVVMALRATPNPGT
jgi:nitrate/nitrite transporter NarK